MIKLVLDYGNTSLKAAFWNNKRLVKKYNNTTIPFLTSPGVISRHGIPEAVLVSSVTINETFMNPFNKRASVFYLNYKTNVPVKIKYKTPQTLGNDRLANATAAFATFPGKPVLVIDAGTCIKFDFKDAGENYCGGSISPGLHMRFKALNQYTERLPLVKPAKEFMLTGHSTKESIIAGVQMGILAETEGIINRYEKKYKGLKIILTGGDYRFLAGNLKKHIFVAPNLTLMGLNEILDYNIS